MNSYVINIAPFVVRSYNVEVWTFLLRWSFSKISKSDYYFFVISVRLSACLSIHPSVHMEQLSSHWTGFHEILFCVFSWNFILRIFMKFYFAYFFFKSVKKIQDSFHPGTNNGYFTWRPVFVFHHILPSSSWKEKCFRQKLLRKSKYIQDVPGWMCQTSGGCSLC